MNETPRHFVAPCPQCAVNLRINHKYAGIYVTCKHCAHSFRANAFGTPARQDSDEYEVGPIDSPDPDPAARIVAVCPACRTTLSVRRIYLGHSVVCKQCDHRFQAREQTERPPNQAGRDLDGISKSGVQQPVILSGVGDAKHSRREQVSAEQDRLLADCHRLQAKCKRFERKYARYKRKYREAVGQLGAVPRAIEDIRIHLGAIVPEDVRSLATERDSLRDQVTRLSEANRVLGEQALARAEHHHEELQRLNQQLLHANQMSQDRDAIRAENDQLRAELESLRAAVDRSKENHHTERNSIEAELTALSDPNQRRSDQMASADQNCQEDHDPYEDLLNAHEAIGSNHENILLCTQSPAEEDQALVHSVALAAEFEDADVSAEDLRTRPESVERRKRAMDQVLGSIGSCFT